MAEVVLDLKEAGITTSGARMDNGEGRFRMMNSDGSGYIRTEAGPQGAWHVRGRVDG